MENFNTVPDKGTFGGSVEVVNQNFSLAQQEMEVLQNKCENESARAIEAENSLRQLYNNLQQSQPIPVTELPATGEAGKIYRLAGTTSYADYMYAEGALTTPIKMAEYNNAIDDVPTAGSDNLVKSRGIVSSVESISKKISAHLLDSYLRYLRSEGVVSDDGTFYVVDKSNYVIAKIDVNGIHAINFFEEGQTQQDDAEFQDLKLVDKFGNIICKVNKNGIQSVGFFDENGIRISSNKPLAGKELFVVGDSLSAGGYWESKVAEITGCTFDQSKNSKSGSQISTGGTNSYGGNKDCGLARILNIKKEGYNPGIIILQNINDSGAFNSEGEPISGTINDAPYIINQILEGYSLSDWNSDASALLNSIPSNQRVFGTSIQLQFNSSGKNLKILTTASTSGSIKIGVHTAQTGWLYYYIHVETSDTITNIVNKILEYNYSLVTDTLGSDNVSVNFSTGSSTYPCNISFEDADNTGVTVSITDVNNAKSVSPRLFIGENLTTDWVNSEKWVSSISFFSAWKGMIEFAKINFPASDVVLLMFPVRTMNPSDYTNANGTFNQEDYNATLKRYEGMFEYQRKVAEIYNIPVIDIHHNCGVTVGNYSQYYYDNNVHPKLAGYNYFGEKIANQLLTI